ncbi:hypothetical protein JT358_15650 [Micrococcales bacterium 31B]|nr:hypothetical protein [Micrococcales bacterium 31B]
MTRDGDTVTYSTSAIDLQRLSPDYDARLSANIEPGDATYTLDSEFRLISYSTFIPGGRVEATCGDFNAVEPIEVPDVEPESAE